MSREICSVVLSNEKTLKLFEKELGVIARWGHGLVCAWTCMSSALK
jgi:hypothetical protein